MKYLSNIMYILYKLDTFVCLAVGVADFHLTPKMLRTMPGSGLCWILYHEHFRFGLVFPKGFWSVVGCFGNDDILIALNNDVKMNFYTDCQ